MPKRKPLATALATLGVLTRAELLELRSAIDDLIEILDEVARPDETGDTPTGEKPEAKGYLEKKMIPRGKKSYGPYLYLRKWKGKTLTSTYLGKANRDE